MWSDLFRNIFITAHVHSMMGRYCFHRCLSVIICGGTQSQVWVGGTPSQVWGGTMSQVWGHTPSQVWVGGTLSQVWVGGTPSQVWMVGGYPISALNGGCTWGYPLARFGWWDGVPGVPPGQVWMVGGTLGTPLII